MLTPTSRPEHPSERDARPSPVRPEAHVLMGASLQAQLASLTPGTVDYASQRAALAPVQASGELTGHVQASAAAGVAGSGARLPHLQTIQRAFGRHDVSHVQAFSGSAAASACSAIGAEAYATGDRVAFAAAPDLHLAAHEAAHVVQQRAGVQLAGGLGRQGDRYERHADEVADAVVQGKSAEGILDRMAGGATHAPSRAVQLRGRGQTHDLGAELMQAEASALGTEWGYEPPPVLAAEVPEVVEFGVRYGLYGDALRLTLAANGRIQGLIDQGASALPPTIEGHGMSRSADAAFSGDFRGGMLTETHMQNMYTDWSASQVRARDRFATYLADRQLLDAAFLNLHRVQARLDQQRVRLAMQGKSAQLAKVVRAGKVTGEVLSMVANARSFMDDLGSWEGSGRKVDALGRWSGDGGKGFAQGQVKGAVKALEARIDASGGVSMSDIGIILNGDAGNYFKLMAELKAAAKELANLEDRELAQDVESAHRAVDGWEMKADGARAATARRSEQVAARNKAADFAKLRTGDVKHAQHALMAQAVYELVDYGELAVRYGKGARSAQRKALSIVAERWPSFVRTGTSEGAYDLHGAVRHFVRGAGGFARSWRSLLPLVRAGRMGREAWMSYLDASAGRSFEH